MEYYAQSIIGATEKRRESGAGVAVIGGIGGLESMGLGGGGVYQEWAFEVETSLTGVALQQNRAPFLPQETALAEPILSPSQVS